MIQGELFHDERLVWRGRLHRVVLLRPGLTALFTLLLSRITGNPDLSGLALIWTGLALVWLSCSIVNYLISEFVVTDMRLLVQTGFLRRRTLQVFLSKVEQIVVKQGFLGQLLNFGSIVVRGPGGTESRFRCMASPVELKKRVLGQLFSSGAADDDYRHMGQAT